MASPIVYRQPVIAPAFLGASMAANPFGVTFYVGNTTNPGENQGAAGTTAQGRSPKNPFATIAAAIAESVSGRGDLIVVQRGAYTEDLSITQAGLTIMGAIPFGYPDHVIVTGTMFIAANGVSVYNMEFFSNSTARPCVAVGLGGTTTAPSFAGTPEASSVLFKNCSFASDGTTEPSYGLIIFGGNNSAVLGCRFVDLTRALCLRAGGTSVISGVRVEGNDFIENTTYHLGNGGGTASGSYDTLGNGFGILNVTIKDNVFNRGGVTPADYVNISGTSSGIMTGNRFANATNAVGEIVIPAGILYSANATEAGWTTARPA